MPTLFPGEPGAVAGDGWKDLLGTLSRIRAEAEDRARAAVGAPAAQRPAAADRQTEATLERQTERLASVRRSHDRLAKRVAALETQRDRGWTASGNRLVSRRLRTLELSAQLQKVTDAAYSAQVAAFGQRGSVLKPNNLLLVGNQLFWGFIGPLLRGLDVPAPVATAATWLAPAGSLLTTQLTLAGRQHDRFITGVATFEVAGSGVYTTTVSLEDRIADGLWPRFQRRTDVPVTVMPLDNSVEPVSLIGAHLARVVSGEIHIVIAYLEGESSKLIRRSVRVAWMVDVGEDVG